MTQLKYLAITTLLLVGGCTTDDGLSTDGTGSQFSDDIRVGEPYGPGARPGAQHEDCATTHECIDGLVCIPRVGSLNRYVATCEIPCAQGCPRDQSCVNLVEGPGDVCWQTDETGAAIVADLPQQGQPCPDRVCDRGLSCVSYYGIAGPRGPLFTSCEIRCSDTSDCPGGQQCVTIADGPGDVCRPAGR